MNHPVLAIGLGWLLFSGTHLLLATDPIRATLVRRLGERGFINAFSLVATATFAVLCAAGAVFHGQGPPGFALAADPVLRPLGIAMIFFGFALMAGSLAGYAQTPMALFAHPVHTPRGVEAVSRHGFFYGVAFWAAAHVLFAPTAAGALFFGGFVVQAVVGSALQDRKLRARLGEPYAAYMASTSAFPFAAIVRGRARFRFREQPWIGYALGFGLALGLRPLHAHLFDYYGLYLVAATVTGGALASWAAERQAKKSNHAEPVREELHG